MPEFMPAVFGGAFDKIAMEYLKGIGLYIAPLFHIGAFILIYLVLRRQNKYRKLITLWFTANYLWMFLYVGLFMLYLFYKEMGVWSLAFWGFVPILLANILVNWIRESSNLITDWDFSKIHKWRLIIVPFIIYGFWFPTFIYGQGFIFSAQDLLLSAFGLMPCPTTILVLGLLTIKYPMVNRKLFNALTLFAIVIGTAQLAIGYVPDYPLAMVGYYSAGLIVSNYLKERKELSL
jgi:hypothetical protein